MRNPALGYTCVTCPRKWNKPSCCGSPSPSAGACCNPRQAGGNAPGGGSGRRGILSPRWHRTSSWTLAAPEPTPSSYHLLSRGSGSVRRDGSAAGGGDQEAEGLITGDLVRKESCPQASQTKLRVESRSPAQRGSSHTADHTYLGKALSPPSPHPLREEEKRGGKKERQGMEKEGSAKRRDRETD